MSSPGRSSTKQPTIGRDLTAPHRCGALIVFLERRDLNARVQTDDRREARGRLSGRTEERLCCDVEQTVREWLAEASSHCC